MNKLEDMKPMDYRSKSVAMANKQLLIRSKNLQGIKSESVSRKIRSEAANRLRRDDDDEIDVLLMKKDHPEYIKQVSSPINIKVFSREQLSICDHSVDRVLYFDATVTVIRSHIPNGKILYYCDNNRKKFTQAMPCF